ncbi:MAG: Ribonuclease, partial [Verrucomicrobiaceae bacterium]|nr:Ribonuclease [Verrucomicrobiaceae bacterium]
MQDKILKLLGRADYAPSNIPALLRLLKLKQDQLPTLDQSLRQLEDKGLILLSKGNRYIRAQEADLVPGIISINRQGKGFLQPDQTGSKEIVIPESATGTAMNGDHVLVRLETRGTPPKKGKTPVEPAEMTGKVIRILERKRSQLVGTLKRGKSLLFVVPDDPRIPCHIFVPEPRDVGRKPQVGDKVVVEILYWESKQTNPEGEIIEVLGPPDAEGVDMLSVLKNYDLPLSFPKEVLQEAVDITSSRSLTDASAEDMAGRTDCRDHMVITIDPDDAKDFDDAICVKRISPDKIKLWVHIADVSHYVKPGGRLDTEARKRGNSTYLVDRVIPMLPEALSNELCSLKPHVDRLTKCVEFSLTNEGTVTSAKFYPAAIRSQRRFTYQEVLQLLQQPPGEDPIELMVHAAHNLAQHIRKARFRDGSLDLDFPENKIRLDENGKVL